MATAKKRGNKWRCLVYIGKDSAGKRKYKSCTGRTKLEAERAAALYDRQNDSNLTISEAIDNYIDIKAAVLSPATVRAYKSYSKCYESIGSIRAVDLTDAIAQKWISDLVKDKKSEKYVANAYGLLRSSLAMHFPKIVIRVSLPRRTRKRSYVPTNAEIQEILPLFDNETQIAILLAAYCSLRCGEICALTSADLSGSTLTINKALAINPDGEYVTKQPKTAASIRTVPVPAFVLERIQPIKGKYIKKRTPLQLSNYFCRKLRRRGYEFHFHDLRHFFASELAKTMPLAVIEHIGGWSPGSPVLRQIYIGTQQAEMQKNMDAAAAVFDGLQAPKKAP